MFKFFTEPKWYIWAYVGSVVILTSIWVQVQIDVQINEWFGEFYDTVSYTHLTLPTIYSV